MSLHGEINNYLSEQSQAGNYNPNRNVVATLDSWQREGQRLGLPDLKQTPQTIANHEAGHFGRNLEQGIIPSGYFVTDRAGGVISPPTQPGTSGASNVVMNAVSGAASEALLAGQSQPVRSLAHFADIMKATSVLDQRVDSPNKLKSEDVDQFYGLVQARMDELSPHANELNNLSQTLQSNRAFAAESVPASTMVMLKARSGLSADQFNSNISDDLIEASRSYAKAVGAPAHAEMTGVGGIDWSLSSGPRIPNGGQGSPSGGAPTSLVNHFQASNVGDPLRAFVHAVSPGLDTNNETLEDANRFQQKVFNTPGSIPGAVNTQSAQSGQYVQVGQRQGVSVQGNSLQANINGVNLRGQPNLVTTDENGKTTAWRTPTNGRQFKRKGFQASAADMAQAEVDAHLAGADSYGVASFNKSAFNAYKSANPGSSDQEAMQSPGVMVGQQTGNMNYGDDGNLIPSDNLMAATNKLGDLAEASRSANGLGADAEGFAPRVDPSVGASDPEVGQLIMAQHADQQLRGLSGQYENDDQVNDALGGGMTKADMTMTAKRTQTRTFTGFGNAAARAVKQLGRNGSSAPDGPFDPGPSASAGGSGGKGKFPAAPPWVPQGGDGGGGKGGGEGEFGEESGGSGNGRKSDTESFGQATMGQFAALPKALEELDKVAGKAAGSTENLTKAQAAAVTTHVQLSNALASNLSALQASANANPNGPAAQALNQIQSSHGDTQLSQYQEKLNAPGAEGSPSLAAGASMANSMGAVGASNNGALDKIGGIPMKLVNARWAVRGIEQEFLDPMSQARSSYNDTEASIGRNNSNYDVMGGYSNLNSQSYLSAVKPRSIDFQRQMALGQATDRMSAGVESVLGSGAGSQSLGGMNAVANTAMAAGAAGFMMGGPAGGALGMFAGAATSAALQVAGASTDPMTMQRQSTLAIRDQGDFGKYLKDAATTDVFGAAALAGNTVTHGFNNLIRPIQSADAKAETDADNHSDAVQQIRGYFEAQGSTNFQASVSGIKDASGNSVSWSAKDDPTVAADASSRAADILKSQYKVTSSDDLKSAADQSAKLLSSYRANGKTIKDSDLAEQSYLASQNPAFSQAVGDLQGIVGTNGDFNSGSYSDASTMVTDLSKRSDGASIISRSGAAMAPYKATDSIRGSLGFGRTFSTMQQGEDKMVEWNTINSMPDGPEKDKALAAYQRKAAPGGLAAQMSTASNAFGSSVETGVGGAAGYFASAAESPQDTAYAAGSGAQILGSIANMGLAQGMSGKDAGNLAGQDALVATRSKYDAGTFLQAASQANQMGSLKSSGLTDTLASLMTGGVNTSSIGGLASYGIDQSGMASAQRDIMQSQGVVAANNYNTQQGIANQLGSKWATYGSLNAQTDANARAGVSGSLGDAQMYGAAMSGDVQAGSMFVQKHGLNEKNVSYYQMQTGAFGGTAGYEAGQDEDMSQNTALRQDVNRAGSVRGGITNKYAQLAGMNVGDLDNMNMQQLSNKIESDQFDLGEYQYGKQQNAMARSRAETTGVGLGAFAGQMTAAGASASMVSQAMASGGQWGIENKQVAASRAQEDYGYQTQGQELQIQQSQFTLAGSQFQESQGLKESQARTQRGWQMQDTQISHSHSQQQAAWGIEDLQFSQNKSDVSFGWQMEDDDRNIRYARGRERQDLMRQRSREVVSHAMDSGQNAKEQTRDKTQEQWEDQQYQREVKRYQTSAQYEEQGFALERKQFDENRNLQQQSMQLQQQKYQKEREFIDENRKIEDQARALNRASSLMEMKDQEQIATHVHAVNTEISALNQRLSDFALRMQQAKQAATWDQNTGGSHASSGGTSSSTSFHNLGGGLAHGGFAPDDGLPSYDDGGYTGLGGQFDVAGTVHKGEYVVPQNGALVVQGDSGQTAYFQKMVDWLQKIYEGQASNFNLTVNSSNPASGVNAGKKLYDQSFARRA